MENLNKNQSIQTYHLKNKTAKENVIINAKKEKKEVKIMENNLYEFYGIINGEIKEIINFIKYMENYGTENKHFDEISYFDYDFSYFDPFYEMSFEFSFNGNIDYNPKECLLKNINPYDKGVITLEEFAKENPYVNIKMSFYDSFTEENKYNFEIDNGKVKEVKEEFEELEDTFY